VEFHIGVFDSRPGIGEAAAAAAAGIIRNAIAERGQAFIVAATGASQFEPLDALARAGELDWSRTTFFHLDEYIGLPQPHPASFRRYLQQRIVDRLHPGAFHFIDGDAPDPAAECRRLGKLISARTIDLAFTGIGENGHLAFNEPPADFETDEPYIVVSLAETSRQQQVREGWFNNLEEVPAKAISMSVKQILKSENILCIAPGKRKARAVQSCFEMETSPWCPASVLREHPAALVYVDSEAASLLSEATVAANWQGAGLGRST